MDTGPCHLSGRRVEARLSSTMTHYIAIIEDAGPNHAVGVWFPDLPGCTSAGDDIDEALRNAPEALELYADAIEEDKSLPRPRTLTELKADPEFAADVAAHMVALIELPARAHAAE
jgi:predicted RNase H-like HicB family nuclease